MRWLICPVGKAHNVDRLIDDDSLKSSDFDAIRYGFSIYFIMVRCESLIIVDKHLFKYRNFVEFIKNNIWLIGIALISGGALLLPFLQRRGPKVNHYQATQLINQGKTLVLDVRTADKYADGHLQGAKNIPLAELDSRIKEIEKSKNNTVITVCDFGKISVNAAATLAKAGFANVFSLEGGITGWKTQGLPTVK
jgi:rhodanese-related sulfurtransferase